MFLEGSGIGCTGRGRVRHPLDSPAPGNRRETTQNIRVGQGDITVTPDQLPTQRAKTHRSAPAEDSFRLNAEN